jgi:pantetheine-phosphate adenylyltransferase
MSKRIAVFPGSFDPITIGHEEIVKRALPLFDEIIVAIGLNSAKAYQNSLEIRLQAIKDCFKREEKIRVETYEGLTMEYCKSKSAHFLLRGLRNPGDFEFERNIALINRELNPEIESIFLISDGRYSGISSTIVREIQKHGGDFKQFIPEYARHLF